MEDRSCRNNILLDGVTEEKGETWEYCEKKVLEILTDKLEIEDATIERAPRLQPRTIVCKLLNDKGKTPILRICNCLEDTSYYIKVVINGQF